MANIYPLYTFPGCTEISRCSNNIAIYLRRYQQYITAYIQSTLNVSFSEKYSVMYHTLNATLKIRHRCSRQSAACFIYTYVTFGIFIWLANKFATNITFNCDCCPVRVFNVDST